ncbi:GAF domain-containing sensor histidine kinase [Salinimicrobium sediminilitoris]|uniref:GAF domain-containing sensor histidine kinase n=1 Tax=Salinimicrobium sediminilitoris TaxID=2876715 RepID=UPI002104EB94|nr:GAF domain-containing sensor histidine kinase [Salinimicrobium sediminilitoris]MCC8358893.1 GAF domain-containing sensor histidine kinase [Salinimicrobium sediminilitoris]
MLDVICRSTKMGFAAIARVTDDRWITCAAKDLISFGLKPGDELEVETTICHEVHKNSKAVYIDHVAKDPAYCDHHTPKIYGIQSYISVPVYRKNGEFFGTLCAIDPNPKEINTPEITGMFQLFSELISFHLDVVEKMMLAEEKLKEEREVAELRDQFIAILGHDLKNPIATMRMSADILLKMSKEDFTKRQAAMIKSTSFRMQTLIENVLDFAKGKLGEGIVLEKKANNGKLTQILEQVIKEVKVSAPKRDILFDATLREEVFCDKDRIGQLFANLLSNANQHGSPDAPIRVKASTTDHHFELNVSNKGDKIPENSQVHLFEPFYRDPKGSNTKGLGLGLYIASEIAKAHKGVLEVNSTEKETSFSLQIPLTKQ